MQFHTEAEKGQCQISFEIQKNIFFEIQKKQFESQFFFLENIFEQFVKSETLLEIFIILIDPQIFFTNPKLVCKSKSLHQILKNILEI